MATVPRLIVVKLIGDNQRTAIKDLDDGTQLQRKISRQLRCVSCQIGRCRPFQTLALGGRQGVEKRLQSGRKRPALPIVAPI